LPLDNNAVIILTVPSSLLTFILPPHLGSIMNGFANHHLNESDFEEPKGLSVKTFDAFRTSFPLQLH
jgi:hypothetical protein